MIAIISAISTGAFLEAVQHFIWRCCYPAMLLGRRFRQLELLADHLVFYVLVEPVVLWESGLLRPEQRRRPSFYRNILADGIRIAPAL